MRSIVALAVSEAPEAVNVLPEDGHGLEEAIERWARSPELATLVAEFGGDAPASDEPLLALLNRLAAFSERWDYRRGAERNLVEPPAFDPARRRVVLDAAHALGLVGRTGLHHRRYDHLLVLGGLARACLARPLFAARLLAEGEIEAGSVTALGGYRELKGDEIELVRSILGDGPQNEFDVMDDGVRNAFGLGEASDERGEESDVVGASWRVREYAYAYGLPVRVVAAASPEPGRRPNTADTYGWFASELAHLQPGERLLLVTSDIYVPYQHADALRMLALPYRVEIETAGMRPGEVDQRLAQNFLPHDYLQEIRSTILALRNLHSTLAVEGRRL